MVCTVIMRLFFGNVLMVAKQTSTFSPRSQRSSTIECGYWTEPKMKCCLHRIQPNVYNKYLSEMAGVIFIIFRAIYLCIFEFHQYWSNISKPNISFFLYYKFCNDKLLYIENFIHLMLEYKLCYASILL
jgi:hypothetical protein